METKTKNNIDIDLKNNIDRANRIKLIYIMQEFSPDVGGWALNLFKELSRYMDVVVLARPYKHSIRKAYQIEYVNKYFKVVRYKAAEVKGILFPKNLIPILRREYKRDKLIVQMDEFFKPYTLQAAKWCRDHSVPYIISSRMRPRKGLARYLMLFLFRELAQDAVLRASKIIATQGDCSKTEFQKWFWLAEDSNFEIIPSGLSVREFKKNGKFKPEKDKENIILCVGRVEKIKRLDLALRAFDNLLFWQPDAELWIVGKIKREEMLRLNKLINQLRMRRYEAGKFNQQIRKVTLIKKGKNVKFFGGVENKDLPKFYSKAKLLWNTSETEGICFSFLEAMAFSLPIIAWKVGGNPGVVESGHNGWLFKFGNIHSMVIKTMRILGSDQLREGMGNNGYQKLMKEFDIKKNSKKLLNVYTDALLT